MPRVTYNPRHFFAIDLDFFSLRFYLFLACRSVLERDLVFVI